MQAEIKVEKDKLVKQEKKNKDKEIVKRMKDGPKLPS